MAFPRGPPAPRTERRYGGRAAGGRGPRAPGAAGGGWRLAFRGTGGSGGAAPAQPCVTARRGQGRRGRVWWGRERGAAREPARRWRGE